MRPYAPDKKNPFPRPRDDVGTNGGGNKNGGVSSGGLMPGEIQILGNDMMLSASGELGSWKNFLKDVYSPNIEARYNFGGGGNGRGNNHGGGKNDPKDPPVDPRPDTANPGHNRMAPMGMMSAQRGFLPVSQPMTAMPTSGLFAAQQAQMAQRQAPQQPQPQFPPEILEMMRARQMGR